MDLLLMFLDSDTKQIVWFKFIRSETVSEYNQGLQFLLKHNFEILSVTIDGRKGVKELFLRNDIIVQICQFHQIMTVKRYLTSNPRLVPSLQLKTIVEDLNISNYTSFKSRFDYYLEVNKEFINERSVNSQTGKQTYTHKKLRSAIRSIQTNLPHLFTYQVSIPYADLQLKLTHKVTSKIPNTTNYIDGGVNPKIRELVRSHRGMRKDRRNKLLSVLLASLGSC